MHLACNLINVTCLHHFSQTDSAPNTLASPLGLKLIGPLLTDILYFFFFFLTSVSLDSQIVFLLSSYSLLSHSPIKEVKHWSEKRYAVGGVKVKDEP